MINIILLVTVKRLNHTVPLDDKHICTLNSLSWLAGWQSNVIQWDSSLQNHAHARRWLRAGYIRRCDWLLWWWHQQVFVDGADCWRGTPSGHQGEDTLASTLHRRKKHLFRCGFWPTVQNNISESSKLNCAKNHSESVHFFILNSFSWLL